MLRTETFQGKRHTIVPVAIFAAGIRTNSDGGAIYYSKAELSRFPEAWNQKPITLGHPDDDEAAITPDQLEARQVGMITNAKWEGGKLRADAWLDSERLHKLAPKVARALENGEPVETSPGLHTFNLPGSGVWKGTPYDAVATQITPDHLAILQGEVGEYGIAEGGGLNPKEETIMNNQITANASGYLYSLRIENKTFGGRDHLVVPVTMITEGVHAGSNGPLFYPDDELSISPEAWDGMPVTLGHPESGSANTPEGESVKVGVLMNCRWQGGKLRAEAWIDPNRLEQLAPEVAQALHNRRPMEVSTGLYADFDPAPGTWNGQTFDFIARNLRPDHLALLPTGVGACSVADGCGAFQTNEKEKQIMQNQDEFLPLPVMNFGELEKTPSTNAATCPCNALNQGEGLALPVMNFDAPQGDTGHPHAAHGDEGLVLPSTL